MKRKYDDKTVGIIKELMFRNYETSSIVKKMYEKYNKVVSTADLNAIRKGESYQDIKPYYNQKIKTTYITFPTKTQKNEIREIKWALANDYPEEEIRKLHKLSKIEMQKIKTGCAPYYNIAPEYNSALEKRFKNKKQVNINDAIVVAIKRIYVENSGEIKLAKLAEEHKIRMASVSNIINLKYYKSVGNSYNDSIERIKNDKSIKRITKEMIKTERSKISEYKQMKNAIPFKIKQCEDKIKKLRSL